MITGHEFHTHWISYVNYTSKTFPTKLYTHLQIRTTKCTDITRLQPPLRVVNNLNYINFGHVTQLQYMWCKNKYTVSLTTKFRFRYWIVFITILAALEYLRNSLLIRPRFRLYRGVDNNSTIFMKCISGVLSSTLHTYLKLKYFQGPVYTYHPHARQSHHQSLTLCQWWWTVWRKDWVWNLFCLAM